MFGILPKKKIISIDHEKFHTKPWGIDICEQLSHCIKKFFGDDWIDNQILNESFTNKFKDTWESLISNIIDIGDIYRNYQFSKKAMLLNLRKDKGPDFFLGHIML